MTQHDQKWLGSYFTDHVIGQVRIFDPSISTPGASTRGLIRVDPFFPPLMLRSREYIQAQLNRTNVSRIIAHPRLTSPPVPCPRLGPAYVGAVAKYSGAQEKSEEPSALPAHVPSQQVAWS